LRGQTFHPAAKLAVYALACFACRQSQVLTSPSKEHTVKTLNIRRLVLDVDKALRMPSLIDIALAIQNCRGVEACNITVSDVDIETVGTNITIEGSAIDYDEVVREIENTGAAVHSLDQIVVGERILENTPRAR
jgi:uncharacterized protein